MAETVVRESARGKRPPPALLRTAVGGTLMGIANLIPGVSGGTMILAMGLYEEFIESVADITALRLSLRRIVFLGVLGVFACSAIVLLAGVILYLLFHYTSAMYALFIGLTLGGAPVLGGMLRPVRADTVLTTLAGFLLMLGVALLKENAGLPHNTVMDVIAGIVGATTMVLPGISGSYMLLIMEQYDRVVGAVRDLDLRIIIPVGIGVVIGIVGLSNALKFLLHRYHRATVGVLLGLLLGSVVGLWPFGRQPAAKALERRTPAELRDYAVAWQIPGSADVAEGELVAHILAGWASRRTPTYSGGAVAVALVLAGTGFVTTYLVGRGGRRRDGNPAAEA